MVRPSLSFLEKQLPDIRDIVSKSKDPEKTAIEVVNHLTEKLEKTKRQPKIEPPIGGITITQASKKYNLPVKTIHGWVKNEWITILMRTAGKIFISESEISSIVDKFGTDIGRGNVEIARYFQQSHKMQ